MINELMALDLLEDVLKKTCDEKKSNLIREHLKTLSGTEKKKETLKYLLELMGDKISPLIKDHFEKTLENGPETEEKKIFEEPKIAYIGDINMAQFVPYLKEMQKEIENLKNETEQLPQKLGVLMGTKLEETSKLFERACLTAVELGIHEDYIYSLLLRIGKRIFSRKNDNIIQMRSGTETELDKNGFNINDYKQI